MFNNPKRVTIASVLAITTLISTPFNAFAAGLVATNLSQLQAEVYQEMTKRDTNFTINYKGSTANNSSDITNTTKAAEQTDDYLSNSWTSMSVSASGTAGNLNINYKAGYLTTAAQEDVVNTDVTQALAQIITPGMTDFQKEKAIHDWITKTVSYDYTLQKHSAYDALVSPNKAVCQGYTLLMYKMLTQAGITTRIVTGTLQGGSHAWNMVQIGGNWYHVDATNDDVNNNIFYNQTDAYMKAHSFVWDTTKFPAATTTYTGDTVANTVSLNKTTDSLTVGGMDTLTATATPTLAVTWKSSDASVVTVNNGAIIAVKAGTATVTATTADGVSAICTVTVNAAPPVAQPTTISLNKITDSLKVGGTDNLIAKVTPVGSVTWKSGNTAVVTVSNGLIKGVSAGTATVTATTADGVSATCTVTVNAAPAPTVQTTISLNRTTATVNKGARISLLAKIASSAQPGRPIYKPVTWTSSDNSVATVTSGTVYAIAPGTATITIATQDGSASATCKVTVMAPTPSAIKLNKTTDTVLINLTDTITATVTPAKPVTWKSSDPSTVYVYTNGVIKGVKAGTATITATTSDGATATCEVTVSSPVMTVSLTQTQISIARNKVTAVGAKIMANGKAVWQPCTWTSSDSKVATVKNGIITTLSAGTTVITVTTPDGQASASCTVIVK